MGRVAAVDCDDVNDRGGGGNANVGGGANFGAPDGFLLVLETSDEVGAGRIAAVDCDDVNDGGGGGNANVGGGADF